MNDLLYMIDIQYYIEFIVGWGIGIGIFEFGNTKL